MKIAREFLFNERWIPTGKLYHYSQSVALKILLVIQRQKFTGLFYLYVEMVCIFLQIDEVLMFVC